MTNEQKVKVIETLDRTKSVREVKLVYSTLAENFKYTSSTSKANKKSITEGIASKAVKSTKPAQAAAKQVIAESADFSARFKKLAGIIK
jgi:dGTP triphosphohydrolase